MVPTPTSPFRPEDTRAAAPMLTALLETSHAAGGRTILCSLPRGMRFAGGIEALLASDYGSRTHADLRHVHPDGKGNLITIHAIRDQESFLRTHPATADTKTLVLHSAHRMNAPAANAALKILEEPHAHTRIILMTDSPERLLPTIRSRCILTSVTPSRSLARADLVDQIQRAALAQAEEEEQKTSSRKGNAGKPSRSQHDILTEAMPDAETLDKALDLSGDDPTLAHGLIWHGLDTWLDRISDWMNQVPASHGTAGKDRMPAPPLPTLTGKTAVQVDVALDAVCAWIAVRARPEQHEAGLPKGWSHARMAEMAWSMESFRTDSGRAGLDAKARLHAALTESVRRAWHADDGIKG